MADSRYPYFSRAGWIPFLVCALAGGFVAHMLGWIWSLPFWLVCIVIVYLYRDPNRDIPSSPLAVVSPADGLVASVEDVFDPYLERQSILLIIQMSTVGVYSTRSPVEGKILEPKNAGDGSSRPHGVWLKTDEGDDLVVVMHRGPLNNLPLGSRQKASRANPSSCTRYPRSALTPGSMIEMARNPCARRSASICFGVGNRSRSQVNTRYPSR